jgi:membrane carboxypeptidase/penicillin-binding protein
VKTLAVLAALGIFAIAAVVGIFLYISSDLPQINSLKDYNPPMNYRILSRDNEILYQDFGMS